MAKITGHGTKIKGSVGSLTYKRRNGETIISEKVTDTTNTRTSAQQKQRMKWANPVQAYKVLMPALYNAFENKASNVTDYNMFMKLNINNAVPVYLTKSEVESGACIAAPYQITKGSLPSIAVSVAEGKATTDISLGTLTISSTTTVAEFSNAVVQNNSDYDYGDQIAFYMMIQKVNAVTEIPYCQCHTAAVVLDKDSTVTLQSLVGTDGFSSNNGYLAYVMSTNDNSFAWVHSLKESGKTKVSSQLLIDNNDLLAEYTTTDAYTRAVKSYGGEKDVFLTPSTDSVTGSSGGATTKYTLNLSASPSEGGSVTGAGSYEAGTEVDISAVANSGYTFTKWSDENTNASRSVTMNADTTLQAIFTADEDDEAGGTKFD